MYRSFILVSVYVFFNTSILFADAQSKELEAARARYDAALAAATRPVRDRYMQELEQLKNKALGQKNLELAVAIDKEIALNAVAPAKVAIKTAKDLESYLGDTSWSWGTSEKAANSRLHFRKDGTCVINKDTPNRWTATDDSTVQLDNGTSLKFSSNNKTYTATTASGPRVGKKL